MKNLKYFPFQRNQYYYGKLLTEQDFIQEQRYVNDKRRMQNRLLHGVGVAAGFRVVEVDEKSISIEAGLALDFAGREIVSDTPVMRKLSTIDGFDAVMEHNQCSYVYLCLEYEEYEEIPVHNAAVGINPKQGSAVYDKVREGYHLYLTDREPEHLSLTADSMMSRQEVLYQDSQLKVVQKLPKSIKGLDEFETVISIENRGIPVTVALNLTEELSGVLLGGKGRLEASIEETTLDRAGRVEVKYRLRTLDLKEGDVSIQLHAEQFKLRCAAAECRPTADQSFFIPVVKQDRISEMKELFFKESMEEAIRDNYPQGIYLSRIYLIKTEDAYIIDHVENMPFGQYVYSSSLLTGMTELLRQELGSEGQKKSGGEPDFQTEDKSVETIRTSEEKGFRAAQGIVTIDLGVGGKRGQRYFSRDIFHGLGLGSVSIETAIQEEDTLYSGSSEVFEHMGVRGEMAVKADMAKGSFVVGLRLLEASSSQTVKIHWSAFMEEQGEKNEDVEKRIYILPGKLEMKIRESYYLEAVCENMPGSSVVWKIKDEKSGYISQDGMYTAPNIPGVYEVIAQCQGSPEIRSVLFIVVRE